MQLDSSFNQKRKCSILTKYTVNYYCNGIRNAAVVATGKIWRTEMSVRKTIFRRRQDLAVPNFRQIEIDTKTWLNRLLTRYVPRLKIGKSLLRRFSDFAEIFMADFLGHETMISSVFLHYSKYLNKLAWSVGDWFPRGLVLYIVIIMHIVIDM